eukprot:3471103-Rhodomonas_salina.1
MACGDRLLLGVGDALLKHEKVLTEFDLLKTSSETWSQTCSAVDLMRASVWHPVEEEVTARRGSVVIDQADVEVLQVVSYKQPTTIVQSKPQNAPGQLPPFPPSSRRGTIVLLKTPQCKNSMAAASSSGSSGDDQEEPLQR